MYLLLLCVVWDDCLMLRASLQYLPDRRTGVSTQHIAGQTLATVNTGLATQWIQQSVFAIVPSESGFRTITFISDS